MMRMLHRTPLSNRATAFLKKDFFLSKECLDVIEKHPEVREWLI